jgi:FkbH-like protein
MTLFSPRVRHSKALAAAFRANRTAFGRALYSAVRDKSCASWQIALGFEELEEWGRSQLLTAIDLLVARFETSDPLFLELFAGWVHSRLVMDLSREGAPSDYKPNKAIELVRILWIDRLRSTVSAEAIRLLAADMEQSAMFLAQPTTREQRILFIGDCLQFEALPALLGPCVQARIGIKPTLLNERVQAVLRNRIRAFAPNEFDLVFFSPFSYTFLPEYEILLRARSGLWPVSKTMGHLNAMVEEVFRTLDTLAGQLDCPIYVHNTSGAIQQSGRVSGLAKHVVSWRNRTRARRILNQAMARYIADRCGSPVKLVDENALRASASELELGRMYLNSYAFHPTRLGVELGRGPYFQATYSNAFLLSKKAVVCDLDNTLWDGVIGEGLVSHYLDRQATLKELRRRGVLLSIISKNDSKNVHWSGAALQPDDFVAPRINWEPKTANMVSIRDELNLKVKDFVFIDDRRDELERMRNAFPEILALDATDPATWCFLSHWRDGLPPNPVEDRTKLYHERVKRERFVSDLSKMSSAVVEDETAAFRALELSVKIQKVGRPGLKRAVELINRTNQFNLCGSRTSERELASGADARHMVVQAEAADKFGSMGVVGIMKVERHGDRVEIPIFVLSCRAFGFGIEHALLNAVRTVAPGDCMVAGHYKETQFNQVCRQFYPASGMRWDGSYWIARVGELSPAPSWLTIENTMPAWEAPQERPIERLPGNLDPSVAFSADVRALLGALSAGEGQQLDLGADARPLPNWEHIAVRADLDEGERLVLGYKLQGISQERAIADKPSEAEREKIAAAWRRFEQTGIVKLRSVVRGKIPEQAALNNPD